MSDIKNIADALETKVDKLINRLENLKQENQQLEKRLLHSEKQLRDQHLEVDTWKTKYDTLKIANGMLGSDDNKRETKLKINALIREIDQCIGQLSE